MTFLMVGSARTSFGHLAVRVTESRMLRAVKPFAAPFAPLADGLMQHVDADAAIVFGVPSQPFGTSVPCGRG
jgi:hypothetical protein